MFCGEWAAEWWITSWRPWSSCRHLATDSRQVDRDNFRNFTTLTHHSTCCLSRDVFGRSVVGVFELIKVVQNPLYLRLVFDFLPSSLIGLFLFSFFLYLAFFFEQQYDCDTEIIIVLAASLACYKWPEIYVYKIKIKPKTMHRIRRRTAAARSTSCNL